MRRLNYIRVKVLRIVSLFVLAWLLLVLLLLGLVVAAAARVDRPLLGQQTLLLAALVGSRRCAYQRSFFRHLGQNSPLNIILTGSLFGLYIMLLLVRADDALELSGVLLQWRGR